MKFANTSGPGRGPASPPHSCWWASAAAVAGAQTPSLPSDDAIRQILRTRIDEQKKAVGIVVGVVSAQGTRVVGYGVLDESDKRTPGADNVFEIGSASKVFTSLLLMDMVARGEMKVDDPVSKYLPKDVRMPSRNGKEITLQDLSMHVSGLPRLPSNFPSKDVLNLYAGYTARQMYDFLSQYQLERDPGEKVPVLQPRRGPAGPRHRPSRGQRLRDGPPKADPRAAQDDEHRDRGVGLDAGPPGTGPRRGAEAGAELGHPDAWRCRGDPVHGGRHAHLPQSQHGAHAFALVGRDEGDARHAPPG